MAEPVIASGHIITPVLEFDIDIYVVIRRIKSWGIDPVDVARGLG